MDVYGTGSRVAVLSEANASWFGEGVFLLMVGSYAPAHAGHVAAMKAARIALTERGQKVAGMIYVPNTDSYVSFKIQDTTGAWNFARRVAVLREMAANEQTPVIVDDISGSRPIGRLSITRTAMASAARRLGISEDRLVVVVGSDQAASMKPYLATNQAICVVRPGAVALVLNLFQEEWFYRAVASGRYLFTERDNPYEDISSTAMRQAAQNIERSYGDS